MGLVCTGTHCMLMLLGTVLAADDRKLESGLPQYLFETNLVLGSASAAGPAAHGGSGNLATSNVHTAHWLKERLLGRMRQR